MAEITLCDNPDCTVAQTGTCVLGFEKSQCSHFKSEVDSKTIKIESVLTEPLLVAPEQNPKFPPSTALGVNDVSNLLAQDSGHIIGILGSPDSGKTALLVSLYLSLSNGSLSGFSFADSKSLLIFDELSRGARQWAKGVPEQMTTHTELQDDREAGFLHLKLNREKDGKKFNIYIPDLPGEWSTSLIDKNEHERLSFLKSATTIWIMVDGSSLLDINLCRQTIHKTKMLLMRVSEMFKPDIPNLRLVITRLDLGKPKEGLINEIVESALKLNFDLKVDFIASFSRNESVSASTGISELLNDSLAPIGIYQPFWPQNHDFLSSARQILKFGIRDQA